jgi:ribonucrease Y
VHDLLLALLGAIVVVLGVAVWRLSAGVRRLHASQPATDAAPVPSPAGSTENLDPAQPAQPLLAPSRQVVRVDVDGTTRADTDPTAPGTDQRTTEPRPGAEAPQTDPTPPGGGRPDVPGTSRDGAPAVHRPGAPVPTDDEGAGRPDTAGADRTGTAARPDAPTGAGPFGPGPTGTSQYGATTGTGRAGAAAGDGATAGGEAAGVAIGDAATAGRHAAGAAVRGDAGVGDAAGVAVGDAATVGGDAVGAAVRGDADAGGDAAGVAVGDAATADGHAAGAAVRGGDGGVGGAAGVAVGDAATVGGGAAGAAVPDGAAMDAGQAVTAVDGAQLGGATAGGEAVASAERMWATGGGEGRVAWRLASLSVADREELKAQARREVERELTEMRSQAIQNAASVRSEAETLAAFTRSMAEAEAATLRRTAETEVENIRRAVHAESENARHQAALEASTVVLEARRQADQEATAITGRARAAQAEVERREERLAERERRLDDQHRLLEQRGTELAERARQLDQREADAAAAEAGIQAELERVARLTTADAKAELLKTVEAQCRLDAAIIVRDIEAEARQNAEQTARHIVVDAIQRVASEQTAESVVSVLHLPGDEMKGRIIGREGRNIRAFESVTGVNLIIDDTPEAVLLSCFDPVRREIGRLTLEKLVLDGRIHPQRIEEIYERSREEVERLCLKAGEDALVEVGITEIHPELVKLLGRLRYRTSYGQNVLKHLIETAHIAGIMAAELRMDGTVLKRSAFLHDIGKALTHEVEGSHALIGADLARKFGEHEEVVHAIEAHHNEVPPQTIEAVLTQASDACSGGRPGARRESLEAYVKRLERIEEIASGKPGVDRVFAMQAGREVRVIVQPEQVDDVAAHLLAREVAKQIEDELTYPGQIRVTVVRETRSTEIAR